MDEKIAKMIAVASALKVGSIIPYRSMQAKVEAFSDEHLFLSVPEIAVAPDDIEQVADGVRVRDREVENLKRRIYGLEQEIDRLKHDPYYRDQQRRRDEYERERRMSDYRMVSEFASLAMKPIRYPTNSTERVDIPAPYYDPIKWSKPSQQKG